MKCKNCDGNLIFKNGALVCDSCGASFALSDYHEDIDTYILYVENDESGRRTKDSIIANDLYQKFEANGIKTFYSRISASELIGDDFEKACISALASAKTVVVLGTEKDHFVKLSEKYSDIYKGKVIIPVFADTDIRDVPKDISAIQAVDYNKIGADVDLVKSILNALGRNSEADINSVYTKSKKNKRVILIAVIVGLALALGVFAFMLFGTDIIIRHTPEETVDLQEESYNTAVADVGSGKYSDAIKLFYDLGNYRDSEKQLQSLYEKYAGYYQNEDKDLTLHFQVLSGNSGNAEIVKTTDKKQIRITESAKMNADELSFDFNDSENNQGTVKISLNDDSIALSVKTEKESSDLSFGTFESSFVTSEKSDKPFTEQLNRETLLGFVKETTTMNNLKRRGFELTFEKNLYKSSAAGEYRIKNTDVYLAIFTYNLLISTDYYGDSETSVEDPIVFGVMAPAKIIIPDHIGEDNTPFEEDGYFYVPDGELAQYSHPLDLGMVDLREKKEITNDTQVAFVCKNTVGEKLYQELINYFNNTKSISYENSAANDEYANSGTPVNYLKEVAAGTQVHIGPGNGYDVAMTIEEDGTYTIVEEKSDARGFIWGKLKSGAGWIQVGSMMSENANRSAEGVYLENIEPYTITIPNTYTKVYDAPGYGNNEVMTITEPGVYTIVEEYIDENNELWGKLKSGVGWIDIPVAQSDV